MKRRRSKRIESAVISTAAPTPVRIPLAVLIADALMTSIREGEWQDRLPGERALCARYQVSRPSLRQALARLEKQGWIRTTARKFRYIRRPGSGMPLPSKADVRRITFLSAYPINRMEPFAVLELLALRQMLAGAGYRLEMTALPHFIHEHVPRNLEALVHGSPSAAWILYRAPQVLQEWFAERRIPAAIMGTSYPGVRLSSVDLDFRATSRHAVGLFLRKGHRPERLCLLSSGEHLAGIEASQAGFFEGVGRPADAQDPRLVTFSDGPDLGRHLSRLFSLGVPPTGLIVQRPVYALTTMGFLMARLHRTPPEGGSLVAMDDDPALRYAYPPITRYTKNPERFARELFRVLMKAVEGLAPAGEAKLIMPDLIDGETLGPPPA